MWYVNMPGKLFYLVSIGSPRHDQIQSNLICFYQC